MLKISTLGGLSMRRDGEPVTGLVTHKERVPWHRELLREWAEMAGHARDR
jgi:hypothetical protein